MRNRNAKVLIETIFGFAMLTHVLLGQQISSPGTADKMAWFADAKLGIFIHWGIYAVNGIDESWSFFNGAVPYDQYMKQLHRFSAARYDPGNWAKVIRESGARYAVLTSKHHDGVALWDTRMGDLSVVKKSPARRDLVTPFVNALRDAGIKVGLYFSLIDWSHKDYPAFTKKQNRYKDDPKRWNRFLKYMNGQIDEVMTIFQPDLLWFDGDWEHDAKEWEAADIRCRVLKINPETVINSRLQGYGDYLTPEQQMPIAPPPGEGCWELCLTMNDSWGYQGRDTNYKSANQIIRIFADCLGMGGNLLLNIGPLEDGAIPLEQVDILRELGCWSSKHAEAIYGTRAGLPPALHMGPSTLSKDNRTLYLFLPWRPSGPVAVKGLLSRPETIRVVGSDLRPIFRVMLKPSWSEKPGILYIDLQPEALDTQVTVLALEFKEAIRYQDR